MAISHVVRGADLVTSTPRQIWLSGKLGAAPPRYTHVPLVVAPDGTRLEKRTPGVTIRALRAAGLPATTVIGALAHGLGLRPTAAPSTAVEVGEGAATGPIAWRRAPWPTPAFG
jgi:glutamyl-tRNA synthetase